MRGGPVGPGDDHARGVGGDEEVRVQLLAPLPQRVEDGGLVVRLHQRLEGGIVAEDADAELQLVVAVGLERFPDLPGLREALVDRLVREAVGLHGGEGEGRPHQGHDEEAREDEDLLGEPHQYFSSVE